MDPTAVGRAHRLPGPRARALRCRALAAPRAPATRAGRRLRQQQELAAAQAPRPMAIRALAIRAVQPKRPAPAPAFCLRPTRPIAEPAGTLARTAIAAFRVS